MVNNRTKKHFVLASFFCILLANLWLVKSQEEWMIMTDEDGGDYDQGQDGQQIESRSTLSTSELAERLSMYDWMGLLMGNSSTRDDNPYFTCRLQKNFLKKFKESIGHDTRTICQAVPECHDNITVIYSNAPPLIYGGVGKNRKNEVKGILKGKIFIN